MANTFGLLLLAVSIAFIVAQLMKDAKAFGKFMGVLIASLIVGAGAKAVVNKITANEPEKAVVVSTEVVPTQSSITPFVSEDTVAFPEIASKEITTRDRVETETEGLPTQRTENAYIDDS